MSLLRISHVVNPVNVDPTSDLFVAQPITFETMRIAKQRATSIAAVELAAVGYDVDLPVMPHGFRVLPPLTRSVLDVGSFQQQRKLPLLGDILEHLYESCDADFLIYTNVDIGLQPDFYLAVANYIDQGYDTFVINRRTISNRFQTVDQLPQMWAEAGEAHRGWDCFVFPRVLFPHFKLGNICVGMPRVGLALLANLVAYGRSFKEFKDAHLTFHIGDDRRGKISAFADYHEHNTRELMTIIAELEKERGSFGRETIPGAFLWRKRGFGRFYEAWVRYSYLPASWSQRINRIFGKLR